MIGFVLIMSLFFVIVPSVCLESDNQINVTTYKDNKMVIIVRNIVQEQPNGVLIFKFKACLIFFVMLFIIELDDNKGYLVIFKMSQQNHTCL